MARVDVSVGSPALARIENWFWLVIVVAIALIGLLMAQGGLDAVFSFHGVLFFAAAAIALMVVATGGYDRAAGLRKHQNEGYNELILKWGVGLAVFWGLAGFLVGLVISLQLAIPVLNLDMPWTAFGRLRPTAHLGGDLRLSAATRADQHLVPRRPADQCGDRLAGRRATCIGSCCGATSCSSLMAATGLPAWACHPVQGIRGAGVVCGLLADNRLGRLSCCFHGHAVKRKEPHIYVANWFYLAFIVTVAMLHL